MISLSASQVREQVAAGKLKPSDVITEYFKRIRQADPTVKAYLTVMEQEAAAAAQALEKKIARKEPLGPLAGVPVAIKDNMCTAGVKTTCASQFLKNFVPPYDATVVEKLKAADAILIGKTNMDEFAMGSSTENSSFFPTRNPYDPERIPGGSSGGSAAAVAAHEACVALGSDTGGSIRQPAALTGTVGFKPTYGMVSRYGLVAFASSLDQIGPITRTVADAAQVMDVIAGKDPRDATSVEGPAGFSDRLKREPGPVRLGVPQEYFGKGLDPEIHAAVTAALKVFEKLGARLEEVSLPMTDYGIAAYYIVAPSEASSNLARYDGVHFTTRSQAGTDVLSMFSRSRAEGFGPEVKRRIMLGTYALSSGYYEAYYLRALKVRRLIKNDFDKAFRKVDFIVGPTSPVPAFKLGERVSDPLQMYLCDIFTVSANLAGLPGISLPCGYTKSGLPIGLQIMGKAFADADILRVAHRLEASLGLTPPALKV